MRDRGDMYVTMLVYVYDDDIRQEYLLPFSRIILLFSNMLIFHMSCSDTNLIIYQMRIILALSLINYY